MNAISKKKQMSQPILFSLADLERDFSRDALQRGAEYAGRQTVMDLSVSTDGTLLRASVLGTRPKPYKVTVSFSRARDGMRSLAHCSCPVGFRCKHAAAVLLTALAGAKTRSLDGPDAVTLLPEHRLWLTEVSNAASKEDAARQEHVRYLFTLSAGGQGQPDGLKPKLALIRARVKKDGGVTKVRDTNPASMLGQGASFVDRDDLLIAELLGQHGGSAETTMAAPLRSSLVVERVVATGRAHYGALDTPPLVLGHPIGGQLGWERDDQGAQRATILADAPGVVVLAFGTPFYVDAAAASIGPLRIAEPDSVVRAFLRGPKLRPGEADAVRAALAESPLAKRLPAPERDPEIKVLKPDPVPLLQLLTLRTRNWNARRGQPDFLEIDLARVAFDYAGWVVPANEAAKEQRRLEDGVIVLRQRAPGKESAAHRRLAKFGFETDGDVLHLLGDGDEEYDEDTDPFAQSPAETAAWQRFVHQGVPQLRAEGWRVEIDPEFRHKIVEAGEDWDVSFGEGSGWWFSLELGVVVEGERMPLLPALLALVARLRVDKNGLTQLSDETIFVPLPSGKVLALPAERIRPIIETLLALHDATPGEGGALEIPLSEAEALQRIADATKLRWLNEPRMLGVARALREAGTLAEADPPDSLRATLRPYQRRGLAWMGLLAANGLGGVLADDMGLGKTVQTLAHILAEKLSGRRTGPVLVVCPTSLVSNWEREAAQFAPDLRVLRLHGPTRAASFDEIGASDLVLSTYALLPRDAEALLPVAWHLVVLDEAQAIKNPASKAAQAACKLNATHRLCLTGTPVENHLGELFSQFSFLMPGLLGDATRFNKVFRVPIEKKGDVSRRDALAARLRPFMLRRTKEQVLPELPPRTDIVQRIALDGPQRDLYETVRLAMHKRVRDEIAARGFARSRIVLLDALLKLRQVCCHPKLVKLPAAKKVSISAKLEQLIQMLPQLIEEGRRVLLFSQFTSMLDLIVPELDALKIPFVQLRGDTTDRATPVAQFQAGIVPLFLISLKAGGVGLNLTAADTVIMFDPWWNPAVEQQAAGRAHRIGQDKPVFVYKMIAEGTIEDRMLELQARKQALAGGLLDDDGEGFAAFQESDVEALLRPIG
jgi:superfamily II DNA or RNA helicase